jgi:hypothetical protein
LKKVEKLWLLSLILLLCSCASYQAFPTDTSRPAGTRIAKSEQKGLVIAAEDYSDTEKCEKYFCRDLHGEGYIPIFVCLENRGEYEFTLRLENIILRYEDGTEAKAVDVDKVIRDVQSSPANALFALPLCIIPTFFIWPSITEANYQLDMDYTQKALHNSHITSNNSQIFGFAFFQIPRGREATSLQGASLELTVVKKASAERQELAESLNFTVSISAD